MCGSEVDGVLVRQENPGRVFAGEGKDKIGPGHYEIKRELKTKGTNWHASTAERDFVIRYNKLAENANLGPGSYEIERAASRPKIKYTTVYPGSKIIAEQRDEEESSSESESNDVLLKRKRVEGDARTGTLQFEDALCIKAERMSATAFWCGLIKVLEALRLHSGPRTVCKQQKTPCIPLPHHRLPQRREGRQYRFVRVRKGETRSLRRQFQGQDSTWWKT
eukprot:TRINITY_DN3835_c0_g1_i4.p1 TRINITY_DN3835_c0_g1~~TRINITY_DN3835_c0_g1_i4.p1  ORF type:complete len:221 (-),score=9.21 TRINITY_DN3835_c0_g1_i4:707-1369(-)